MEWAEHWKTKDIANNMRAASITDLQPSQLLENCIDTFAIQHTTEKDQPSCVGDGEGEGVPPGQIAGRNMYKQSPVLLAIHFHTPRITGMVGAVDL